MENFDARADGWDTAPRIQRAELAAQAIMDSIDLADVTSVLEFGSGTGLLSRCLADQLLETASITLLDPSTGMTEQARKVVADLGAGWRVECGDLTAMSASGETFDLIISLLVLHHIDDVAQAFRDCVTLLKPGGKVAVIDLCSDGGAYHRGRAEPPPHDGFELDHITALMSECGLTETSHRIACVVNQDVEGVPHDFPLFLAIGRRPTEISVAV